MAELLLTKSYRFRLRPNQLQQLLLRQFAGAKRWVYNYALARRKLHYAQHRATLPTVTLAHELVLLKRQPHTAWLATVDSQLLQQALRDLDLAYAHYFRRLKLKA